jgi:hypothetical protein
MTISASDELRRQSVWIPDSRFAASGTTVERLLQAQRDEPHLAFGIGDQK